MSVAASLQALRKNSAEEIKKLIASRYSLVWIESWEEDRVEAILQKITTQGFKQPLALRVWSETQGLENKKKCTITEALQQLSEQKEPGVLLIKDFSWTLASPSLLKRLFRDISQQAKTSLKIVFLLSPLSEIPDDMMKEITVISFALPHEKELEGIFSQVLKSFPNVKNELTDEQKQKLLKGALGFTSQEAKLAFQKMLVGRTELNEEALEVVFEEKGRMIQRDGLLDYVPQKYLLEDIGGLENLKEWLVDRASFFSKEAQEAGLNIPKGILLTGVSGCGKSLSCQVIAAAWGLPLYRLDMNRVYGGALGPPEESFRRAILQIEAVAPAILWLEEIEKGVAGYQQGDRGVTARIFSSFLTWLQEHTSPVFCAATANEINALPPELLRKGRFDEIFFVDLPKEKERLQIFEVHLRKKGVELKNFNLLELAKATDGFNGAEIEQCVIAGLIQAFKGGKKPLAQEDIFKVIGRMVPLSTTMAEQIKAIKRWADTRAVKASK